MKSLRSFFETIRVEHTLFALPFAYATLFLASGGWPTLHDVIWITVAMATGRTMGMALNRIIDARIDALNPRTAGRAIPAGRLSSGRALLFTAVAGAIFVYAVFQLQPVCRWLWPLPIAAMTLYPYTKRFSPVPHLFLGLVYFMVPTAVWLAVRGTAPAVAITLGVGAGLWVAGFDIIYACQDVESDRRQRLHSIPADFGVERALRIAQVLHVGFVIALLVIAQMVHGGRWFYVGCMISSLAIVYEHRIVSARDLSRVNAAFFTANGVVSIVLFVMIALDRVM
ncbi:MAG TPA: UbiA-like polyprenyltransferase [Candidatus Krumholzibacteria bacterium]|nr:UbiA-like polyprenyltransferase [Candidatus Krumholzibacteria bacterium]